MEHADLIKTLGGPDRVADAIGCHRTRVVRWRTQGIPASRFPALIELAAQRNVRGLTFDALFAGREEMLRRSATGARPGRPTPDWHAKAAALKAAGLSAAEIGRAFEVNPRTVQRVLRKVGK